MFSEKFTEDKVIRDKIINDILFSPVVPNIKNIYDCIPRPYGEINQKWTKDLLEWDSWKVGALNNAYRFRENDDKGWDSIDSYKRNIMESNIYKNVKNHEKIINEQKKEIDKLNKILQNILLNDKMI